MHVYIDEDILFFNYEFFEKKMNGFNLVEIMGF